MGLSQESVDLKLQCACTHRRLRTRLKKVTFHHVLQSRELFVIDGRVPPREIAQLERYLRSLSYARRGIDSKETKRVRSFAKGFDVQESARFPWFAPFIQISKEFFPGPGMILKQVMCNCLLFGDMLYPHADLPRSSNGVTVLYFANSRWPRDWGGEIVFFDSRGEAVFAVSPKPGRIVAFRADIEHRAGTPLRDCLDERLTLAFKFASAG